MPSTTVNICVLTLVLLSFQQLCHCRPHNSRSKRGLVKDYFVPDTLIFSSDKFEKGDDGKYYLKKNAHRKDSEVKYSPAENSDGKKITVPDEGKNSDVDIIKDELKAVQYENAKTGQIKKETTEKATEVALTLPEESKRVKELSNAKASSDIRETAKKFEISSDKAPFTPVDPKMKVPPKPDSKDEISLKTNLPPIESDEKVEGKISIGQVPDLYSRLIPMPGGVRVPILIPIRHISYQAVKVMPIPPADVSDRLPVPYEDDIIGEGAHESESEEVSQPLAEEKKDSGYHLGNPLAMGVHLPLLSFRTFVKDLKVSDQNDAARDSKVIDVLGKKFLMQSNVMKYPTVDNSRVYLRFLSVKPLDEVNPFEPKETAAEETLKKELEVENRKDFAMENEGSMVREKETAKEKKSMTESETKKEGEMGKETEILKAEETQVKINLEEDVPKEIILKNMGKPTTEEKMPNDERDKAVDSKQVEIHEVVHQVAAKDGSSLVMKNEEDALEKAETQVVEKEIESELKIEDESKEDEDSEMKAMDDGKIDEKEMKRFDAVLKKDAEKKLEMANKKDFFIVEKKKKEKSIEQKDEFKPKKKIEKKKNKCKCEEKDSDSDDDDE